jgi:hypothetical protein
MTPQILLALITTAIAIPTLAAPIQAQTLRNDQLPAGIAIQGKLVAASRFTDMRGDNLVVLSETAAFASPKPESDDERDAALHAQLWRLVSGAWSPVWQVQDRVQRCSFDVACQFKPQSLEVTDLDANGVAEVSFLYQIACVSDVSPWQQKLVLVEDGNKHLLRGVERLVSRVNGKPVSEGGSMVVDKSFNSAPAAFKTFAVQKWQQQGVRKLN